MTQNAILLLRPDDAVQLEVRDDRFMVKNERKLRKIRPLAEYEKYFFFKIIQGTISESNHPDITYTSFSG